MCLKQLLITLEINIVECRLWRESDFLRLLSANHNYTSCQLKTKGKVGRLQHHGLTSSVSLCGVLTTDAARSSYIKEDLQPNTTELKHCTCPGIFLLDSLTKMTKISTSFWIIFMKSPRDVFREYGWLKSVKRKNFL